MVKHVVGMPEDKSGTFEFDKEPAHGFSIKYHYLKCQAG
jgi:hypothetical protein